MPGRPPDRGGPWGNLPLVVDNSAWSRADYPDVREDWKHALRTDRLRISPIARLEMLFSARSGKAFDELAEQLSVVRTAPLTATIARVAEDAMRTLSHRSAGAQRIPLADYLIAAAAQELGAAVIHYDRDYDTLAEIMAFESIWLAPRGTLP
jgi:predicted nucleic acid-binding protein